MEIYEYLGTLQTDITKILAEVTHLSSLQEEHFQNNRRREARETQASIDLQSTSACNCMKRGYMDIISIICHAPEVLTQESDVLPLKIVCGAWNEDRIFQLSASLEAARRNECNIEEITVERDALQLKVEELTESNLKITRELSNYRDQAIATGSEEVNTQEVESGDERTKEHLVQQLEQLDAKFSALKTVNADQKRQLEHASEREVLFETQREQMEMLFNPALVIGCIVTLFGSYPSGRRFLWLIFSWLFGGCLEETTTVSSIPSASDLATPRTEQTSDLGGPQPSAKLDCECDSTPDDSLYVCSVNTLFGTMPYPGDGDGHTAWDDLVCIFAGVSLASYVFTYVISTTICGISFKRFIYFRPWAMWDTDVQERYMRLHN